MCEVGNDLEMRLPGKLALNFGVRRDRTLLTFDRSVDQLFKVLNINIIFHVLFVRKMVFDEFQICNYVTKFNKSVNNLKKST